MKTNQSEVPQYYVENNHEAIINPETFEMVQQEPDGRNSAIAAHEQGIARSLNTTELEAQQQGLLEEIEMSTA